MVLDEKVLRDTLRQVLDNASKAGYLTESEAGFTERLFKKLDGEIDRKTRDKNRLEGEIHQLKLTKGIIINMIKDTVAAAERAKAREETADRIRSGRAARETTVIEEQIVDEKPKKTARRKRTKKKEDKK
jgi:hypothetical protein